MPRLLLVLFLISRTLTAASLSGGLSPAEIDQAVEAIGARGTTRLLRSAEAYESWPGFKIGLEIALVPSGDLNLAGDGTGSLPPVNPLPRIFLSKGLFYGVELSLNFFPLTINGTISTLGGTLKWSFYEEKKHFLHGAFFISYTGVSAFDDTFNGTNWEIGGVFSKDFVRLKPFVGAGILFCRGEVAPAIARTAERGGSHSTLHAFIGAEIETPVNFGVQFDLMNLSPSGTVFIGKKF